MALILLGLGCSALPLAVANRLGRIRYASPLHIVAFLAFFGTSLKVIAFGFDPDLGYFRSFTSDPQAYVDGLIFVFLFIVMLCTGYIAAGSRTREKPIHFRSEDLAMVRFRAAILPLSMGSIILITGVLLAQRGLSGVNSDTLLILNSQKQFDMNSAGVGSTGALVKTLYTIPRVLFIISVMVAVASRRRVDRWSAVFIGVALLGVTILSGDRFDLMRMAGYTLIAAALAGWRLKLRSTLVVVGLITSVIGLATVMSVLRQGEAPTASNKKPLFELVEQIVSSTYFLDVNVATIVIHRMDENDFLMGSSYLSWTYGWIPRAIWHDKPAVDVGVHLKQNIMESGFGASGGVNATGPGEAYMNFGWFGIFMGAVLGAVFRRLEIFTLRQRTGSQRRILYYPSCVFLIILSAMQSNLSAIIISMIVVVPLTAIVGKVIAITSASRHQVKDFYTPTELERR